MPTLIMCTTVSTSQARLYPDFNQDSLQKFKIFNTRQFIFTAIKSIQQHLPSQYGTIARTKAIYCHLDVRYSLHCQVNNFLP